jgi:hypothetical protein
VIDYLKAMHPIVSVSLEERYTDYDRIGGDGHSWQAAVHYYGMCDVGNGPTALDAIHAVIAKRDKMLATTTVPGLWS